MLLKRIGLCLAAGIAVVVLGELAFRGVAHLFLPEYTSSRIVERLAVKVTADRPAVEEERPLVIPHPYLAWVGTPGTSADEMYSPIQLAKMGVEGSPAWLTLPRNNVGFVCEQDIPFETGPDDYVVMLVGGSVARWVLLRSGGVISDLLARDPRLEGRNIVLLNGAIGGYKQPQQLLTVMYFYVLGLEPDAIVNIDGFNEVVFGAGNIQSGVSPSYPSRGHWSHSLNVSAVTPEVSRAIATVENARSRRDVALARAGSCAGVSNLLGYIFLRQGEAWDARAEEGQLAYQQAASAAAARSQRVALAGPDGGREVPLERVVEVWSRSSEALAAFCRERGIHYLHVLQPTAHDSAAGPPKPFSPGELVAIGPPDHPLAAAVRDLYPQLRQRGQELKELGIRFADLTPIFRDIDQDVYYDGCHLTGAGNDLFARRLAEEFLNSLP